MIFQRLSLSTLSNAFSKSTTMTNIFLCHSLHCSRMFRKVKMCSVVPLPFLKPACSGRRSLSTIALIRVMIIFENILLGMESRVIPLQLLQSAKFGNLIILPCVHSSDISSCFPISLQRGGLGSLLQFLGQSWKLLRIMNKFLEVCCSP